MKQNNKNYLFFNFNPVIENKIINKSDLTIESVYNITLENNIIEPVHDFTDIFELIIDKQNLESFYDENKDILNQLTDIKFYEFIYDKNYYERVFVLTQNYKLYEIDKSLNIIVDLNIKFSSEPKTFIRDNKIYFLSKNDILIYFEKFENPVFISSFCNIEKVCTHDKYLYFTTGEEPFKIFSTENQELSNISDDLSYFEYFELNSNDGKILEILNFKDNLYIVQQYNITKMTLHSGKFTLHSYCKIESRIFENTISQIDDYILIYTTSGLYIFDGNDFKQIFSNITKKICNNQNQAVSFNNKYYLTTKLLINDKIESVLLEFNLENNICNIYKIGKIKNIYVSKTISEYNLFINVEENNNSMLLFYNNNYNSINKKYIKFNKMTFDDTFVKTLNSIKFICNGKFYINIGSDISNIQLSSTNYTRMSNLGLRGSYFQIEIFGDEQFFIESFLIEISNVGEY